MLRRNRFGFRMRRRSLSNRLLQVLVIGAVMALFVYFLLYALRLNSDALPPDYGWLRTRNMSHYVLPGRDTVLLEPSRPVCSREDKLRLLVFVHSAPGNRDARDTVRETWGKELLGGQFPGVRLVFLLGRDRQGSRSVQTSLEQEHHLNQDIVQHDFLDSYLNLTLKTTFMLKWTVSNECSHAKFVFKVDDDSFVNPGQLWEQLEHALLHTATTKAMQAYIPDPTSGSSSSSSQSSASPSPSPSSESVDYLFMGHALTAVPIRDVNSKWYIPTRFYPLNIFPRYVSGSGYIFTNSIVPMLYKCALKTPYLNLEDVFLSGLCATTQLGLRLSHNELFRFQKPHMGADYVCYYKTSALVHPMTSPAETRQMWRRVHEAHNCDTFYFSAVQLGTKVAEFFKNLFRL